MSSYIGGVKLTDAQDRVLNAVLDYVRLYGGDTADLKTQSPVGDGRWLPLTDIFPARNNVDNGLRRAATRLARLGVLAACEVSFRDGLLKAEPRRK